MKPGKTKPTETTQHPASLKSRGIATLGCETKNSREKARREGNADGKCGEEGKGDRRVDISEECAAREVVGVQERTGNGTRFEAGVLDKMQDNLREIHQINHVIENVQRHMRHITTGLMQKTLKRQSMTNLTVHLKKRNPQRNEPQKAIEDTLNRGNNGGKLVEEIAGEYKRHLRNGKEKSIAIELLEYVVT